MYLGSAAPASSADIKNGAFTKTSLHQLKKTINIETFVEGELWHSGKAVAL
jgi:hypothetical protein